MIFLLLAACTAVGILATAYLLQKATTYAGVACCYVLLVFFIIGFAACLLLGVSA